MNANIRALASLFTVAFLALIAYLTYWQVGMADELGARMPYNAARVNLAAERVERGTILDRNGQRLAWSETTEEGNKRVYAEPSLVHAIGYYSTRYGATNLEQAFGAYLGAEKGLDPLTMLRKEFLHERMAGADVVTTIDLDLQRVAKRALGDARGAVVALDPRTGEILALVSQPSFDPNSLDEDWERISSSAGQPLVNRATDGQYAPGSTFKTVTLATALESGVVNVGTTFTNKGDLNIEGYRVKYTNPPDRTTFNLRDAYAWSVNAAFAEIGLQLGAERLAAGAARFGFGEAPPLAGVPTATSQLFLRPGFLSTRPALASTAFGQGQLSVTPLEMALTISAVGNAGALPTPRLVSQVRDPQGRVILQTEPQVWKQAMNPATAQLIGDMAVHSVDVGFAQTAQIQGVKVAGKTGTAEVGEGAEPHAWFTGFAPANNPTIAVAVIRENGGEGSRFAAPIARQVMQAWLSQR
ncbi:MAG: peptidoglycan D,D-transpeptidase FtsI family protein [Chloroflexota bacterium]